MKNKDLCKWLRDNSGSAYRSSAIAADRIETLLEWIRKEGERNNTCTKNITGEICGYCQCKNNNRR